MTDAFFAILPPRGDAPLPILVHLPHVGHAFPDFVRATYVAAPGDVQAMHEQMTDHHARELLEGATARGATVLMNRVSRLVHDPERFADDAREPMSRHGLGMAYTRLLDGRPLRRPDPEGRDRAVILERFRRPYATAANRITADFLERFGEAWILDGHTYPLAPQPFEDPGAPRPVLCLGFDPGDRELQPALDWWAARRDRLARLRVADGQPALAHNTPFAGSYVPSDFLDDPRVHSVMLEVLRESCTLSAAGDDGTPVTMAGEVAAFLEWFAGFVAGRVGVERGR